MVIACQNYQEVKDRAGGAEAAKDVLNTGDPQATVWLALAYFDTGEHNEALAIIETLLEQRLTPQVEFEALLTRAVIQGEVGLYERALESLDSCDHLVSQVSANLKGKFYGQRAWAHRKLGATDRSLIDYEEARYWLQEAGDQNYEGVVRNNLAGVYSGLGKQAEAITEVDGAIAIFRSLADRRHLGKAYDQKAQILIKQERFTEAEQVASKAVSVLADYPGSLAEALITRGRILAHLRDPKAKADLYRAISLCEHLGDARQCAIAALTLIEEVSLDHWEMASVYPKTQGGTDELRAFRARNKVANILFLPLNPSLIELALEKSSGALRKAADLLGISHPSLIKAISKFDIARKPKRRRAKSIFK